MKDRKRPKGKLLLGALALVFILGTGLLGDAFILTARAESQAKVTANSVKIRKGATTDSEMVGGADNGALLTVISQQQGGDGYTWYQVQYNNISGFVRGDLVQLTEGSAPPEGGSEGGAVPPQDLTQVNPVEATVTEQSGRIRSEASVSGQILVEVQSGTVLTVTGHTTDTEGKTWYQVNYASGETTAQGFIRGDYVNLSGELQPAGDPGTPADPDPAPPTTLKKYETVEQEDGWYLVETETNNGYSISQLMEMNSSAAANNAAFEESLKTAKNQKIIIIVLVFLLVAAAAGIAFLVFKVRDMMDSAYFDKMENDVLQKKNAGGQGSRRAMQTVGGGEKPSARQGSGRPASGGQARPAGSQGARPAGSGQARPAGNQGARPAGSSQGGRGAGTGQGTRMTEAPQGGRPASQGQRRAEQPRPAAPQSARPAKPAQTNTQKSQPRNFMEDDDEFDFEFLNYDGDEE